VHADGKNQLSILLMKYALDIIFVNLRRWRRQCGGRNIKRFFFIRH
jgi:hypothetical protein